MTFFEVLILRVMDPTHDQVSWYKAVLSSADKAVCCELSGIYDTATGDYTIPNFYLPVPAVLLNPVIIAYTF